MTLYRQYRPTTFAQLFGQDTVRTILQNALSREKVSHAYLFSGPRGTGKTTTARILARAMTCDKPLTKEGKNGHAVYEPCNKCANCLAQLADHAPDIVEIDAASNRGIEDIRQLREQAQYLPMTLKKKVYIIDEVHMLTPDAFNALLKTLEEPPSHCTFILATTEIHKVPATIRSRCQLIRFEKGSEKAIAAKLQDIIKREDITIEPGVVELIAHHAGGGFRDAETVFEQLLSRFSPLTLADTKLALGSTSNETLSELLTAVINGSIGDVRTALSSIDVSDQHQCETLMSELIDLTRERIYTTPAPSNEQLLALTHALTCLLEGYVLIKASPHPKLVLESACFEIVANDRRGISAAPATPVSEKSPTPAIAERAAAPITISLKPEVKVSPTVRITPLPAPSEPKVPVIELRDVAMKDVRQAWKEAIKSISRESAPLAQMLREAVIHTAESGLVTLYAKYKFHVEKLSEKKNKHRVEVLLEQITHEHWTVEYHLRETLPRQQRNRALTSEAVDAASTVFGVAS